MANIYLLIQGQQQGPYSEDDVRRYVAEGRVTGDALAWQEGLAEWAPLASFSGLLPAPTQPPPVPRVLPPHIPPPVPTQLLPPSIHQMSSPGGFANGESIFLYIPIGRLIVMSVISLHIYEAYWIYRNWRYLKERDNLNIIPFWRGFFGIFFVYPILKAIRNDRVAGSIIAATFSAGGLATGWIILILLGNAVSRVPDPIVFIVAVVLSAPSVLFLVPAQMYINRVNEALPVRPAYYKWSAGHILILVLSLVWDGLIILGLCAQTLQTN